MSEHGALIVTNDGGLGSPYSVHDAVPSVNLLGEFLKRIQTSPPPPVPPDSENWVRLENQTVPPSPPTYEHAHWISSEKLEQILGSDLATSTIKSSEQRSKTSMEQMQGILSLPGKYAAVTDDEKRFEYLVDRHVILELVAKRFQSNLTGHHEAR